MAPDKTKIKELLRAYRRIRPDIKKRLEEFRKVHKDKDEKIFSELAYCILTANANAVLCDKAVKDLEYSGLLLKGNSSQIRPSIKGRARFHNKKADYIVGARSLFKNGGSLDIKGKLDPEDIMGTRDWLVENIKGYGYKEASHFLRNIGLGRDIAILDRHILNNLKRLGVIREVPDSAGSRQRYLAIEDKMREFSRHIGIPMDHLDLLFWSMQTGFVFK